MRRTHLIHLAPLVLSLWACSSGTSGGCAGSEPLPAPFPSADKKPNVAATHISQAGFDYINKNWRSLILAALPGAQLSPDDVSPVDGQYNLEVSFPFPCTPMSPAPTGMGGSLAICDNGTGGPGTAGFMDGVCDGQDSPCPALISIEGLSLAPASPDLVQASIRLKLYVNKDPVTRALSDIYIASSSWAGLCGPPMDWWPFYYKGKRLGAKANFYSVASGRPDETFSVVLKFSLDPDWDKQMTFTLVPAAGSSDLIGGVSAIEPGDIGIAGTNRALPGGGTEDMCDYAASAAGWGPIKDMIIGIIKPLVSKQIENMVAVQRCRKVDAKGQCPLGSVPQCYPGQTCKTSPKDERICWDAAHNKCVPLLLGIEQRMAIGQMLQTFGGDPDSKLDLFFSGGGADNSLQIASDFSLGMTGGMKRTYESPCVPHAPDVQGPVTPAYLSTASDPNYLYPAGKPSLIETEDPAYNPAAPNHPLEEHHVAFAVSEYFLNHAFWEAHQDGALCLSLSSDAVAALNSGTMRAFLFSLGLVAGDAKQDAPMMVNVRPLAVPKISVGAGTWDPVTKRVDKPLITVDMSNLRLDFYAMIENRWTRLFTLGADVKLPLSLITEGCPSTIAPALGDLKSMITIYDGTKQPTNSEILAEDPQTLVSLIPVLLTAAEGMVGTLLKPMALPELNGFRLQLDALKGIDRIGTTDEYAYLALYASLASANAQCMSFTPSTRAQLVSTQIPSQKEIMAARNANLPYPKVVIAAEALGLSSKLKPEFAWRVDGGLWSTWRDGPTLEVEHPALLAQGLHTVEVRSRIAGEPGSADPNPASVHVLVDWQAPRVALKAQRATDRLVLEVSDAVSSADRMTYAYKLGQDRISDFGPARELTLTEVERAGGIEVQVKDQAGNVGSASWHPATQQLAPEPGDGITAPRGGAGCSASGGGLGGLLALLAVPAALRRRRAA